MALADQWESTGAHTREVSAAETVVYKRGYYFVMNGLWKSVSTPSACWSLGYAVGSSESELHIASTSHYSDLTIDHLGGRR